MRSHLMEVPYAPNINRLLARAGLDAGSDEAGDFMALLAAALPHLKPRAGLLEASVAPAGDGRTVVIGGVPFASTLLSRNLADETRAWPFLATCGREAHEFAGAIPDPFERFWADIILFDAMTLAVDALDSHFEKTVPGVGTATMSPGSLPEWPIEEQAPLFGLLAGIVDFCGVTLTESMLMLPAKSVSGIRFHSEHGYVSCRLCPRERCETRRVPYEPDVDMAAIE